MCKEKKNNVDCLKIAEPTYTMSSDQGSCYWASQSKSVIQQNQSAQVQTAKFDG